MFLTSQQNREINSNKNFQKENNIENNRLFIMKNKKSNKFETDFMLMNYIFFPIITYTDYDDEIKIIPFIFYYENNELKIIECPYKKKFTKDLRYRAEYNSFEAIFKESINLEVINKHFEIKYLDDLDINNITDEYYDNFDSRYNYDNSKLYGYIYKEYSSIIEESSYYHYGNKITLYHILFGNYRCGINNKYFSYIGLNNYYFYFNKYNYCNIIKECAINILENNENIKKELENNDNINFIMIKNDERESLVSNSFLTKSEKTYFEINIPYIFNIRRKNINETKNILEFTIQNEIKAVLNNIHNENSTYDEYLRIYDYIISGEIKEIVIIKDSEKEYDYIQEKFRNTQYVKKINKMLE